VEACPPKDVVRRLRVEELLEDPDVLWFEEGTPVLPGEPPSPVVRDPGLFIL